MNSSFLQNPILLNIGQASHNADWNYTNITSPFFRIYLILDGQATLTIKGKHHILSKGKMYLIPPYVLHDDSCDGHFSLCYIHIYENNENRISVFDEYVFPIEVDASAFEETVFSKLLNINPHFELQQYDPKSYSSDTIMFHNISRRYHLESHVLMQTKGLINYLLAIFLKDAIKSNINNDNRVYKAAQYIGKHLNSKLTLNEIANHCNISADHLIRLFKRDLKTTPISFINKKKMEQAQLMMILNKCYVKDIAYSLSYDNISYFNRVFKDFVGMTPTEYTSSLKK